ncbi:MAG TPA: hypothetical protein VNN07_18785 [Candidatus Tectomicrobia bacterium]|nr:hypothetical protein [Candidatus Tectomicrobia bacterium]
MERDHGTADETPFGGLDLWEERDFPLAGPSAYPIAVWFGPAGGVQRPDARELTELEAILLALACSTVDEIDRGRRSREVHTHDGPRTVTLAIPAPLEPLDAPRHARVRWTGARWRG